MTTRAFPVTQAEHKHLRKTSNLNDYELKYERTQVHKRRSLGHTYVVVSDWALARLNRRRLRDRMAPLVGWIFGRRGRRI